MDYKRIFDDAMSQKLSEYTFSDNDAIMKKIEERAKAMNNNENANTRHLTEISVEHTTPKKSRRVFNAVAGTAAAAAVISGGVFGVKWLSEHGGLREGGIESSNGAGYHETVSSESDPTAGGMFLTQSDKDLLDGNAYPAVEIPENTRFEFDGFAVEPRWCTFDGLTLHLAYDVVYEGEPSRGTYDDVTTETVEHSFGSGYELNRSGNRVVMKAAHTFSCINDTVTVYFVGKESTDRKAFTVRIPDNVHTLRADTNADIPLSGTNETVRLEHIEAAQSGISLMLSGNSEYRNLISYFDVTVKLADGTERKLHKDAMDNQDLIEILDDGRFYISLTTEKIDPSDIDEIKVNDIPVYQSSSLKEPLIVTIPDLTGLSYIDAVNTLTELGLAREKIRLIFDDSNGNTSDTDLTVITQSIPAGTRLKTDSELELVCGYESDTTSVAEKETSIVVEFTGTEISGMYDFLFYFDGELQKDRNSTDEISQIKKKRWMISGTGTHTYKILVRCPENRLYETLVETTVDFDGELPGKGFEFTFDRQILKELSERPQGDLSLIEGIYAPGELPEVYNLGEDNMETVVTAAAGTETAPTETFTLPDAVADRNGFYGEYLDTPLTGDDAWELVKELGGIDFDFPLPYDKNLFVFDGCEFYINYADCDVKALVGGTVEFTGWHYGWGNSVLIRDDNGHYWFWGHLAKDLNVAEGDTVEAGAKIGHTGSSGCAFCQCYAMRVG